MLLNVKQVKRYCHEFLDKRITKDAVQVLNAQVTILLNKGKHASCSKKTIIASDLAGQIIVKKI